MSNNLLKNFRYGDKVIWIVYLSLCVISVITLFSASSSLAFGSADYTAPVLRHTLFIIGGIALAGFVYFMPQQIIRIGGYLGLAFATVLLLYLALFGARVKGAARFINLGIFQFQPSEIAKICLVIVVADLLSRIKTAEDEIYYFKIIIGLTIVICGLIMVSNLSTAIILGVVVFVMLFLARINWKYLLGIAGIIILLAVSGYAIGKKMVDSGVNFKKPFDRIPTWVSRVDGFFVSKDPETKYDRNAEGNYQSYYSQLAVARGGKTPFGVLPGNSVERDYLPQAFADYIYAIIVEESGIIGAIFIVVLYFLILFRGGMLAKKTDSSYIAYLCTGLAMVLTFQALVSMMVVVGIIPVTGQPLPMITRGGTSVLITSIYFGILLGVSRVQNGKLAAAQQVQMKSEENIPIVDIDEIDDNN